MLGDLEESFVADLSTHPVRQARLRYIKEAVLFIRPHTLRALARPRSGPLMIKNYLQVAWRFTARHKTYSAINLAGLAVGLGTALLIALFVLHEQSYDRHLVDGDRIYRLVAEHDDGEYDGIAKVNGPYGPTAGAKLSDIEASTRFVFFGQVQAEINGVRTPLSGGFYADSTVFQVFSWPLISGDPSQALLAPNSMVLSETMARTLFDRTDVLGEVFRVGTDTDYRVTGVMRDVPETSHFVPAFLASMASYQHPSHDDWVAWNQYYTYLKLRPQAQADLVSTAATRVVHANLAPDVATRVGDLHLQKVQDIYLRSNMFREIGTMGSLQTVRMLSLIALFILLLAALNFINLSTARAALRSREVGVRKSLGARRGAIMRQFLAESTANVGMAWLVGLALAFLFLPAFNELSGKAFMPSDLVALPLQGAGLLLVIGLGILAGAYPAFVLSGFRPVAVMRGSLGRKGNGGLRRGLVLVQFVISIGLLMSAGIVSDQLSYLSEKPLGFDDDNLVGISIQDNSLSTRLDDISAQMAAVPGVVSVSLSANRPGGGDWGIPIEIPGVSDDDRPGVRMLVGDAAYPETFRMQIAAGRALDPQRATDRESAVLINQEFARQLNWEDPIGQEIRMPAIDRAFQVVGVLEDFHFRSAREAISPVMLFSAPPDWYSMINVRLDPARTAEALADLETIYAQYDALNPFSASFMDARYQALYAGDERTGRLLGIATLLAFLVACLGLFGLAAHAAERRTKEIGVRKAIGASVPEIMGLLTRETVMLIALAVLLATPLAILFGSEWLEEFAYRSEISAITLAVGALTAVAVGVATTALQAFRAAKMNPVSALRIE